MKRLLLLCLLACAPIASAGERPPVEHDTKCTVKAPKRYHLRSVLRHGFPATIHCNGPANVTAAIDIEEYSRKARDFMASHYAGGYPGVPARSPYRKLSHRLDEAGTIHVRMKLFPWVRPVLRKLAPFPLQVELGIELADGHWWIEDSLRRQLTR